MTFLYSFKRCKIFFVRLNDFVWKTTLKHIINFTTAIVIKRSRMICKYSIPILFRITILDYHIHNFVSIRSNIQIFIWITLWYVSCSHLHTIVSLMLTLALLSYYRCTKINGIKTYGKERSVREFLSSYDLKFNLFEFSYLEYNMNMCVGWHPWHNQHKKVFICVLLSCVSL